MDGHMSRCRRSSALRSLLLPSCNVESCVRPLRQLQSRQLLALVQVVDASQAVLMQVQASQVELVIKAFDLAETISLEPQRTQPSPALEPLDALIAAEVKVQLLVEAGRRIQVLLLNQGLQRGGGDAPLRGLAVHAAAGCAPPFSRPLAICGFTPHPPRLRGPGRQDQTIGRTCVFDHQSERSSGY
eukprot:scaffold6142_cov110-Isochrysis_galbana.AAC.5